MISQLKKELKPFHMSIIISSGFWIDGDDEREIVFLFAYLASTPKINKEDIYQAIRHVGGEETDRESWDDRLFTI